MSLAPCVSFVTKKGRLFFENIKGHSTPFANVLSTGRNVAVALGIEGDKRMMFEKCLAGFRNPVEPKVLSRWAELGLE